MRDSLPMAGLFLLMLASIGLADDGPRLRICTGAGPVQDPHEVLFGGQEPFYAALLDDEQALAPFRPARALRGVEWRLHRLKQNVAPGRDGIPPGQEVAHRRPGNLQWGLSAVPFICPDELRACWSSGSYLLSASHPAHGDVSVRISVTTILLLDFESRHEVDGYEARFRVALADPEIEEPSTPLEIEIVDKLGRPVDRVRKLKLVLADGAHVSPRPIQVSSHASAVKATRRLAGEQDDRWPTLLAVPDGKLRVIVGDRVFEFALPIEEGMLVRRSTSVPWGREGPSLLPAERKAGRLGSSGQRGRSGGGQSPPPRGKSPGNLPASTKTPDPARTGGGGEFGDGPDRGRTGETMEIVSDAGRDRVLRIWMGEPVTFAARLRPRGLDDVFRPTDWLRDVYWTLTRHSIPTDRKAIAIIPGTSMSQVGRAGPRGLWGDPPSLFRCPEDVYGQYRPGRYLLRADRGGGVAAETWIRVAAFELVDVDPDLRDDGYVATLRLRLTDPDETRTRVPVSVRIIGERNEVVDFARGVSLSRDASRRDVWISAPLTVSTKVARPFKSRYEGEETRSEWATCVLKATLGCRLRIVLDGSVFSYPLPLTVVEVLTGRSGVPDQPAGR